MCSLSLRLLLTRVVNHSSVRIAYKRTLIGEALLANWTNTLFGQRHAPRLQQHQLFLGLQILGVQQALKHLISTTLFQLRVQCCFEECL